MDIDDYWIPRELDSPALFFIWDFDVAAIVILIVVLAIVLDMFVFGLAFAYIVKRIYVQIKNEGGDGFLSKVIYWYFPLYLYDCPRLPSSIREYIGE